MNLFAIFLTGLTTGGLSCLAMQGGLLASVIANQKEQEFKEVKTKKQIQKLSLSSFDALDWQPVAMFLGTKLMSHTLFGFALGILGSMISLSLGMRLTFQIFAAFFMFATAMNLLNVHPVFRFVVFQPPKFLQKIIHNTSKSKALFTPALLGFFTIFIPCGVTQAMEVQAISIGNPIQGALIMFSFVLGTMPLFALIGVATAKLTEGVQELFYKVAATTLVIMALYSVNGVLQVINSPFSYQSLKANLIGQTSNTDLTLQKAGVQEVLINVSTRGYSPSRVKVKKGIPVKLTLKADGVYSCASDFVFREFGIHAQLKPTDTKTFEFTPDKKGKFTFSCSMGMYSGVMEVI